jgi:type IV secretory pathway TrbF-like protein
MIKMLQKMHRSLFPKDESLLNNGIPHDTSNPYIAARREWSFMYGDILNAKYNWQCLSVLLTLVNIMLVIGFVLVALQAKFIPYAVKVDSLGNTSFAGLLNKENDISPSIINAMIRRYINEARSVISDPVAKKNQLDFVYRSTLGEAKSVLDSFYKLRNPFVITKDENIDVIVNSTLPKSNNTWQIQWTEIHRDNVGHENLENHFEGLLTVEHFTPSNVDEININPLGLYVTHLSWAIQQ